MNSIDAPPAAVACEHCRDTGWRPVDDTPGAAVARCECFRDRELRRKLEDADIPPRYRDASLANFDCLPNMHVSLKAAKLVAEKFVAAYPKVDSGLLFEGTAGVGKTHLAVAILRQLITEHGVVGRFVDYRDLLRGIQNSYNPVAETSEMEILRPVLRADVLLLDELGTRRPTNWVRDTVTQLLNDRYKNRRLSLITTNYADADDDSEPSVRTLTEQIGPYARSRLYEMCRNVPMYGDDFRSITGKGQVDTALAERSTA